ncbi:MAG: hypothetical protein IKZ44_09670 [Clostridia bacterium]|nr:hypothetical protein [Clostridia bacterium]
MASEYLKQKAQKEIEAEAPEKPIVYTRREKIMNWLHYHWYWIAIGAVILIVVGTMLWNVLGIGKVRPDYVFAYVGKESISNEQTEAFEEALALLGADVNGDGTVKVELRQYLMKRTGDAETALFYNQAADAKLLADITKGDSYFFLTDDPKGLQRSYWILANTDGSEPDEDDRNVSEKVFLWENCPTLMGLDLDRAAFSGLSLGRRWFSGKAADGHEADEAFWNLLTKGAAQ